MTPESKKTPQGSREATPVEGWSVGPIERQVRADVDALVSEHPMGEALAEIAFKLARLLDGDVQHMAVAAMTRELRETLLELARLGVSDDDDLEAELSRPDVPSEVRDPENS